MSRLNQIIIAVALLCCFMPKIDANGALWPFLSREEARQEALTSGQAATEDEIYDLACENFERALDKSETVDERIEASIMLVQAHRKAGDLAQAKTVLDKLAEVAPKSSHYAEFISSQAYLQFDLGDYQGALESLTSDVDQTSEETAIANARLLPKVYVKLGRREESIAAYEEFSQKFPSSPDAPANLLELAGVLTRANKLDEAIKRLRQIADQYTDTRTAWTAGVWEAQLLTRLDRWDDAEKLLESIDSGDSAPAEIRAEALFYLARVYEHKKDIDGALEQLSKIEQLGLPEESLQQGRIFRGKLLFISGREDEGLKLVHSAIRANPDNPEAAAAQLKMANILLDQERPKDALREYQYYLETFENPDGEADALLGKGWALYLLEDYREASLMFSKTIKLFPAGDDQLEAIYKAGDSFFRAEMYAEALDIYQQGIDDYPDSEERPEMLFQTAEALRRLGRVDEAQKRLAELESEYSDNPIARKALVKSASIEEERGDWSRAIEVYSSIAERYAGTDLALQALHNRAIIYYRLSRFAHAIDDFEKILASGKNSEIVERAFFMRGWCYYLIGEEKRALDICGSFLKKYPDSKWAGDVNFWIGNYHFNKSEFANAESVFADMAKQYPDGNMADSALFWAAQSALKQKEYLRTIDYLGRLLEKYAKSDKIEEARFTQGDALAALGKFSEAILVFEQIVKSSDSNSGGDYFITRAWGRLGDCNFTLGSDDPDRYEKAISSYNKIMLNTKSPVALRLQAEFKIGRSLEKLGKPDDAFESYMNVVYGHLKELRQGEAGDPLWFTKAAFAAAQIAESRQEWRQALNIYQRVIDADVPAVSEAQKRIRKIRLDHWILF